MSIPLSAAIGDASIESADRLDISFERDQHGYTNVRYHLTGFVRPAPQGAEPVPARIASMLEEIARQLD
jgi:hypothetical protein